MKMTRLLSRSLRTGSIVAIAAMLSVGGFASQTHAATSADLNAQLQALIAQLAALQAQVGAAPAASVSVVGSGSCSTPSLMRNLAVGSTGSDVSALQRFLSLDASIYPEQSVTGYYGPATQAAVGRWQTAHGVLSASATASNGLGSVGPMTRSAFMSACAGGVTTTTTTTTSSTGSVGATGSVTTTSASASAASSNDASIDASLKAIDSEIGKLKIDLNS